MVRQHWCKYTSTQWGWLTCLVGIVSAPLWDSRTSTFAGLLTTSDYINVIQYYWQNPTKLSEIDAFTLSNLRGKQGQPPSAFTTDSRAPQMSNVTLVPDPQRPSPSIQRDPSTRLAASCSHLEPAEYRLYPATARPGGQW